MQASLFDAAGTTGYEDIESIECSADGKEITTNFSTPFADWKSLFGASYGLMPAHIVEAQSGVADLQAAYDGQVTADLEKVAAFWNTASSAPVARSSPTSCSRAARTSCPTGSPGRA